MKKRILLTSILSIIMCVSLIVGATFALFESESKVNIAVTSGTVDVQATISNTEYKTLTQDWTAFEDETVNLDMGGAITVSNGTIAFDRIIPGDGVKFLVNVINNSDVTVKCRTIITNAQNTSDVLFSALKIKVNNVVYYGKTATKWTTLAKDNNGESLVVEIELPEEVTGSEFMGESCYFNVLVEAIQGNADTIDDVYAREEVVIDEATLKTTEDIVVGELENASASVSEGTLLNAGTKALTLSVSKAESADLGDYTFENGEEIIPLYITMDGLSPENEEPILVTLKDYAKAGLDGVVLFHGNRPMIPTTGANEVNADGEYFYDQATGYITFATNSFSNFTIVAGAENIMIPHAEIVVLQSEQYPDSEYILDVSGILNSEVSIREDITFDKAFTFKATQTPEEVENSQYANWLADFIISCDEDIELGELGLSGQYGVADLDKTTTWYTFGNPVALEAGQKLPMITAILPMTYYQICEEVKEFSCAVFRAQNDESMIGKTITVSLAIADVETVKNRIPDRDPTMEDFSEEDGTLIVIKSISCKFTTEGAIITNIK